MIIVQCELPVDSGLEQDYATNIPVSVEETLMNLAATALAVEELKGDTLDTMNATK